MNITTNSPTITVSGSGTFSGSFTASTLNTGLFAGTSTTTATSYGVTGSTVINAASGGLGLTYSSVGYYSIQPQTTKYVVLGKEIDVSGYKDGMTALYISMVNVMGKAFYDEVKKQGVNFPPEIEEYLKVALISFERGKKLDILL